MKFKDELVKERFLYLHPKAQEVAVYMDNWAQKNYKIELTITSAATTVKEDKELNRVSDTHRTGRAFDVRVKDLPESLIAELCAVTRRNWGKLGASVNNTPSLIVFKPHGTAAHLHVQLNRTYAINWELNHAKT